jgi:hypothetical protein
VKSRIFHAEKRVGKSQCGNFPQIRIFPYSAVPLLGPQIKIAEIGFPQTDGTPHQMV